MDQHLIFGGRRNDPNHLMLWKLEYASAACTTCLDTDFNLEFSIQVTTLFFFNTNFNISQRYSLSTTHSLVTAPVTSRVRYKNVVNIMLLVN